MWQRIFIAINLQDDIKKKLGSFQRNHNIPVRWLGKDNLHITMAFIGNAGDQEVIDICEIVREVAKRNRPFSIKLNKVCYGPLNKMPPRIVWAIGEKTKEFSKLKKDLEDSFSSIVSFTKDQRESLPHVTLGRVKQMQFRSIEPEEREDITQDIDIKFFVSSIDVMESKLKKSGSAYSIIESFELEK